MGPYEVLAALGAGGMGEVYRAHDTTLGREVAIKVLAGRFASDPERLVRFEREARILASLNHPNIATIHGVTQSDAGPALVLELVEGLTLQDRLAPGALPLDEALRYARQIAEALEAAHDQGVVHRDLKPANIKIRADGAVKVLDFGIAKILENSEQAGTASTVSTTGQGVLIGTPYYMSPEQARGAEVTRRSDVWAFGTILFEMLTGKRAFTGATTSDVLAAILQGAADWNALPASTPEGIVRLARRCLERDPKARLRDIGDARLDIEDEERVLRGETPVHARRRARLGKWDRRSWMLGAAAIVALVVVGAVYALATRRPPEMRQEVRLQMAPPRGTQFVSAPAVSPDGRRIAFVAAPEIGAPGRVWLRPLSAAAASELPGTEGAIYPFWAADGRALAFFADGRMKRVPAAGGGPVVVCMAPAGRGGVWLDDDTIVFAPSQSSPLMRVNASGGSPVPLTTLAPDETGHRFPASLPGRLLLYMSVNRAPEKNGVRLISMDAPNRAINFIPMLGSAEYVNGFLIFLQPRANPREELFPVVAQPLSLPDGRLIGEPVAIGRVRSSEVYGRSAMSTGPTGVIATLGLASATGQFAWLDRDGRLSGTIGEPATQFGVELSPDETQIATFRSGELSAINLARPVPNRVAGALSWHPIWSPDGTEIGLSSQEGGVGTFALVAATPASGAPKTLLQSRQNVKMFDWNQKIIVFNQTVDGSAARGIWMMPKDGSGQPAPFLQDGAQNLEGRLSPDGKWIAYTTDRSGRFEVEVRSFPTRGPAFPVSVDGGSFPRWRADGRELYFVAQNSRIMAASFSPGTPPVIGNPSLLFEVALVTHPDRGNNAAYEYDVSSDGMRFLVNRMVSPPETSMSVIVDWNPPR